MTQINTIVDTTTSPQRIVGWAASEYANDAAAETPIDCAEEDITAAFKRARDAGHSLAGVDESIDAAVAEPLDYLDYLIVESDGSVAFNAAYSRGSDSSQKSG